MNPKSKQEECEKENKKTKENKNPALNEENVSKKTQTPELFHQVTVDLARIWTQLVAESGGATVKPVTHKERGQLKKIYSDLGLDFVPVLTWAVKNWQKFATESKYSAGLSCWPLDPHIGFLLKHEAIAWQLWNSKMQSIATEKEIIVAAKQPNSDQWNYPKLPVEEVYKPTDEELLAILEGFKS
ncbi:MAG: hypothetical protein WAM66_14500 [Acidobacteriaceae bacterium]